MKSEKKEPQPHTTDKDESLSVEDLLRRHYAASADRQQAGLQGWARGLRDGAIPDLNDQDAGRALNITAAAQRAGFSRQVLYRAINAGTLRAFHPYAGGRARITERELSQWLSGRKEA